MSPMTIIPIIQIKELETLASWRVYLSLEEPRPRSPASKFGIIPFLDAKKYKDHIKQWVESAYKLWNSWIYKD